MEIELTTSGSQDHLLLELDQHAIQNHLLGCFTLLQSPIKENTEN